MMRPAELAKRKGELGAHKGKDKAARRRAESIPLPESNMSSDAALSDVEPPKGQRGLVDPLPTPKRSREEVSSGWEERARATEKQSKGLSAVVMSQ